MEIIIVRHAESIANTQGILQGQTYDTELSELGKKQAPAVAKALAKINIDKVFSSPLQRAYQTATAITHSLLQSTPQTDNRLREINHGKLEGKNKDQIKAEYAELWEAWQKEPETVTFPDGENLQQLQDRVLNFIKQTNEQKYHRIVIVCHDTVIRVILNKILRRQLKDHWIYQLDAAGYSIIDWNDKLPQVIKINENSHLENLQSDLSTHAL